jgi:hypothetical protein
MKISVVQGLRKIRSECGEGGQPYLVQGFNFFDRSQVYFNDIPIPFELKSITEIDAIIDETYLRRPGRFSLQVRNPPPAANLNWWNGYLQYRVVAGAL